MQGPPTEKLTRKKPLLPEPSRNSAAERAPAARLMVCPCRAGCACLSKRLEISARAITLVTQRIWLAELTGHCSQAGACVKSGRGIEAKKNAVKPFDKRFFFVILGWPKPKPKAGPSKASIGLESVRLQLVKRHGRLKEARERQRTTEHLAGPASCHCSVMAALRRLRSMPSMPYAQSRPGSALWALAFATNCQP